MVQTLLKPILPFQGADSVLAIYTQGDAIGLDYVGLSARKQIAFPISSGLAVVPSRNDGE